MNIEEIKQFYADNISYKDWEFVIREKNGVPYLQIQFNAPDNFSGKHERQYCRKWMLSEFMTVTELVETAYKAVRMAEEHELRESFKYKGHAIFNSHIYVGHLLEILKENDSPFDYRKEQ
jgi:hypothetical protein